MSETRPTYGYPDYGYPSHNNPYGYQAPPCSPLRHQRLPRQQP